MWGSRFVDATSETDRSRAQRQVLTRITSTCLLVEETEIEKRAVWTRRLKRLNGTMRSGCIAD